MNWNRHPKRRDVTAEVRAFKLDALHDSDFIDSGEILTKQDYERAQT